MGKQSAKFPNQLRTLKGNTKSKGKIKKNKKLIHLTFVLPRDLLPLSTLGFSLTGFLSVTTSKTVGRSLIKLKRRFLSLYRTSPDE